MTFYDRDDELEALDRALESPGQPVIPALEDDVEDDVSLFDSETLRAVLSAE
ncbi:hypothetical protein [Halosimplex sp. TS25]|uniref:hypothetical protein n=1 Tax=Halosimplex rarum TaxID=3396619 RepID=UPI0039E7C830